MNTALGRIAGMVMLALFCTQTLVGGYASDNTFETSNQTPGGQFQPQASPDGQVLESTIQIIMIVDPVSSGDASHQTTAAPVGVMSLGALVYQHGLPKLYTHNHYDANPQFPLARVDRVLFLNANGEYLAQIRGQQFRDLLALAQDPGMALVDAPLALRPEALAQLTQVKLVPKYAQLGNPQLLASGDVVSVPHRASVEPSLRNERLAVLGAVVVSTDHRGSGSVPVIRLHVVSGVSLVGGDSGGPIWFRGQVVGNTWSMIYKETGQSTSDFWASASPAQ